MEDTSRRCVSNWCKIFRVSRNLTFVLPVVDPGARFLVSASSNRGWHGDSTRTVFVHDIKHVQ
jgi:hypothetical protein